MNASGFKVIYDKEEFDLPEGIELAIKDNDDEEIFEFKDGKMQKE